MFKEKKRFGVKSTQDTLSWSNRVFLVKFPSSKHSSSKFSSTIKDSGHRPQAMENPCTISTFCRGIAVILWLLISTWSQTLGLPDLFAFCELNQFSQENAHTEIILQTIEQKKEETERNAECKTERLKANKETNGDSSQNCFRLPKHILWHHCDSDLTTLRAYNW